MPVDLLTYPAELLRCLAGMPYTQAIRLVDTEQLRCVHACISSPLVTYRKAKTNGLHIKTDVIRGVEKVDAFNEEYGGSMLIFRYYAPHFILY
jgi:hypothetical protein